MSNTIPFIKPKEYVPNCSFCEAPRTKAKHFFESGTGKYICQDCVVRAKQRLDESK